MTSDFDTIRAALRLARRLAQSRRRGGLAERATLAEQLAGSALEALDRIEAGSPEQLRLVLFPRDLSRQAHDLRSQAVALNTQAFALEERSTAWVRAQMGPGLFGGDGGDDC